MKSLSKDNRCNDYIPDVIADDRFCDVSGNNYPKVSNTKAAHITLDS